MHHRPPTPTPFPYTTLFRSERSARADDRGAHASPRGQRGKRMRGMSHAEDRADARGRERAEPHVQVRHASGERVVERSEEHTSELQSHVNLVCRLLLEKKKE